MKRDVQKKANAHIPCYCIRDKVFCDVTGTPQTKRDLYTQ